MGVDVKAPKGYRKGWSKIPPPEPGVRVLFDEVDSLRQRLSAVRHEIRCRAAELVKAFGGPANTWTLYVVGKGSEIHHVDLSSVPTRTFCGLEITATRSAVGSGEELECRACLAAMDERERAKGASRG